MGTRQGEVRASVGERQANQGGQTSSTCKAGADQRQAGKKQGWRIPEVAIAAAVIVAVAAVATEEAISKHVGEAIKKNSRTARGVSGRFFIRRV